MMYIAFVLVFLSIGYKIFELDIHVWSCESEQNTGSCLLAARMYIENENRSQGEKYLKLSCNGKYGLGCFELFKLTGDPSFKKQACELDHKPACEN